ncbi:hypothetical protein BJF79_31255 [Actinomadura sp. CNU-125]|nr:hypothetical protein BJF79_31255 [Actinomadura sp. CNU-125]
MCRSLDDGQSRVRGPVLADASALRHRTGEGPGSPSGPSVGQDVHDQTALPIGAFGRLGEIIVSARPRLEGGKSAFYLGHGHTSSTLLRVASGSTSVDQFCAITRQRSAT